MISLQGTVVRAPKGVAQWRVIVFTSPVALSLEARDAE